MWRSIAGAAVLLCLVAGNANAATLSIAAEATIKADERFGNPIEVRPDQRAANHISQGFNREEKRYSFEYDFSGITAVSSASLFLKTNGGINFPGPYDAFLKAYAGDGQIALSDFSPSSPLTVTTFSISTFTTAGFVPGTDEVTIDVASAVNTLLLGGAQFVGFQVDTVDTNGGGFNLLEPILTIESSDVSAVPVPAAFPLLATAIAAFGLVGWRNKRAA